MNELVFLEPNKIDAVPFTTSKVIADMTSVRHDKIKTSIVKYRPAIETFGKLTSYGDALGGRGNESGYRLNEQQATLLITFLKNTPEVVKFKTELVRQFYAMRTELNRRHVERAQLKPIRREMTDIIKQVTDSKWAYKQYTDLAYKMAVGCIASQLRKQRGADKRSAAVDYMTADEIHAVTEMQYRIAVLLETGMDYQQIKAALGKRLLLQAS
jgi:phage regulator Rha-like protein